MDKLGEPGSARFGNFINYYQFNPPDRRTQLVPKSVLIDLFQSSKKESIYALDIGCNAGDLTCALYDHLSQTELSSERPQAIELQILGIDLDPTLIQRCKDTNKHPKNITYLVADMTCEDGTNCVSQYLADKEIQQFDLIFCFSITMWIHLNHGDAGLQGFLRRISRLGPHIVLEPQPWKCYKSAVRRMKKCECGGFDKFPSLQWRNDVEKKINDYMENECEMRELRKYGTTDWDRCVCLYESK